MHKKLTLAFAALCTLAAGAAAAQTLTQPISGLAQSENEFAFDLYGKLAQQQGNLIFSPFSIANALDMVFLGAQGPTADELASVLHLQDLGSPDLPTALAQSAQQRSLFGPNILSGDFQFEDADALWGAKTEPFQPAYLSTIKTAFGGTLRPVNFANAQAAAAQINDWVSDKTNGRITDLIAQSAITPQTKLVLTDAVYFKAGWATDFDESASKPGTFHVAPGQDVTTRMMHATGHYSMTRGDGMQMLEIPYRYDDASLLIILPDDPNNLTELESELTAQKLSYWLEYQQQFNVTMSIPAFKSDSSLGLKSVLQDLGMKLAFTQNQADLTDIANDPRYPLYVGDVIHKASINVHEKGTEATAATTALMPIPLSAAMPLALENVTFTADHPFIYLIRANGSGDILFIGRITNPTAP